MSVHEYTGLWGFLYDWQPLVAGVLALVAALIGGFLAYAAGLAQVRELKRQNDHLKGSDARRSAHDTLKSARLFEGILVAIDANLAGVGRFGGDLDADIGPQADALRKDLAAVPRTEALIQAGALAPEIASDYLGVCDAIDRFRRPGARTPKTINREIDDIRGLVHKLQTKVGEHIATADQVLKDLSH